MNGKPASQVSLEHGFKHINLESLVKNDFPFYENVPSIASSILQAKSGEYQRHAGCLFARNFHRKTA